MDHRFVSRHPIAQLLHFPVQVPLRLLLGLRITGENMAGLKTAQIGNRDVQPVGNVNTRHRVLGQIMDIRIDAAHRIECCTSLDQKKEKQQRKGSGERCLKRRVTEHLANPERWALRHHDGSAEKSVLKRHPSTASTHCLWTAAPRLRPASLAGMRHLSTAQVAVAQMFLNDCKLCLTIPYGCIGPK